MTAEELKALHAQYRQAVEATRKPESDEAYEKASADMLALRHQLDALPHLHRMVLGHQALHGASKETAVDVVEGLTPGQNPPSRKRAGAAARRRGQRRRSASRSLDGRAGGQLA